VGRLSNDAEQGVCRRCFAACGGRTAAGSVGPSKIKIFSGPQLSRSSVKAVSLNKEYKRI